MTRDQMIDMARQAGFTCLLPEEAMDMMGGIFEGDTNIYPHIESFAKLVAAKERNEILQMCNSASEATKEAKKQLRKDEIFAHSVAAGAIHQAERLTNAIQARQ